MGGASYIFKELYGDSRIIQEEYSAKGGNMVCDTKDGMRLDKVNIYPPPISK